MWTLTAFQGSKWGQIQLVGAVYAQAAGYYGMDTYTSVMF